MSTPLSHRPERSVQKRRVSINYEGPQVHIAFVGAMNSLAQIYGQVQQIQQQIEQQMAQLSSQVPRSPALNYQPQFSPQLNARVPNGTFRDE